MPRYHGPGRLAHKHMITTGGVSGIGHAAAIAAAREGATVPLVNLNEVGEAEDTCALIAKQGGEAQTSAQAKHPSHQFNQVAQHGLVTNSALLTAEPRTWMAGLMRLNNVVPEMQRNQLFLDPSDSINPCAVDRLARLPSLKHSA